MFVYIIPMLWVVDGKMVAGKFGRGNMVARKIGREGNWAGGNIRDVLKLTLWQKP